MSDSHDISQVESRLKDATRKLHQLAPQVGSAKQVKEFSSDQRKNLLARYMLPAIKNGESAASSEVYARSNEAYRAEMEELKTSLASAEVVLAQWTAENASFEAARSLLSFLKEQFRSLPE